MFKKFRNAALLTAALATGSLALASPAAAAPPVAPYNGACGSGYGVVNHAGIGSKGTVFVTYNNSTGYNCAVTVRANPGAAVEMVVSIKRTSDPASAAKMDSGYYTTYAGPVYLHAADQCVDWMGRITGSPGGDRGTNCG
ncbi:spore-associated protein A [Nocardiopsis sp. TSRI0078]|uniref:spore-associated protein A n=1 Tax=unclassified Nocardiopsis TaxID=2649073 RepID=UPI00093D1BD6|nr:spore-associated protein A [Nocardiopsis sp. TSRI0078]OKI20434.1 spore-associated protein A [Nocardiopsis sp. TSRI0078]